MLLSMQETCVRCSASALNVVLCPPQPVCLAWELPLAERGSLASIQFSVRLQLTRFNENSRVTHCEYCLQIRLRASTRSSSHLTCPLTEVTALSRTQTSVQQCGATATVVICGLQRVELQEVNSLAVGIAPNRGWYMYRKRSSMRLFAILCMSLAMRSVCGQYNW